MASVGEQEAEYESDPEEAKISLTMRRREASDDEDEDGEAIERTEMPTGRIDSRVSDSESDGQGAAAEYDDGEESEIKEEELVEEDEEIEEDHSYVNDVVVETDRDHQYDETTRCVGKLSGTNRVEENDRLDDGGVVYLRGDQFVENAAADGKGGEEEKKEHEPFAVPTAGAFYMHDDRFRDSAGGRGRHRRTLGGRKLWESKDDRKWGHDKFEEITTPARHYEKGRRASRDRNRGHAKVRGEQHGYPRGNGSKEFNNNNQNNAPNNQDNAPKDVRGRGPRRYQPTWKTYNKAPTRNKQLGKSVEKSSNSNSRRVSASTLKVEYAPVPAGKHVFSSLNSASPPFYPSASSNKESTLTPKRDEHFSMSQSNTVGGKNVTDFIVMNKLYIDDSVSPHTGKPLTNLHLQASGSSLTSPSQSLQSRIQGKGQNPLGQMAYQSNPPHNQVNEVSTVSQLHNVQRAHPVQPRRQASLQASGQQLGHHTGSESRAIESSPESSKSRTALVGKGKGSVQGYFPYGGAKVIAASGNMANAHGDQNFPTNSTFFQAVMQFGGQHPGGIGVPAVGMAFPGYVGNPGSGNSEMTWLPLLAGAAGALGSSYCSPYLPVDGSYHARPSTQTPSLPGALSKESNMNKPGNDLKSSQRTDFANDELGQRQNKGRRYTEMKFDR